LKKTLSENIKRRLRIIKRKKDPKGSQVPEAVRQHQMQVDKVEGIRCGRPRACQRGKHKVSPNRHQVLQREIDLAHIVSG